MRPLLLVVLALLSAAAPFAGDMYLPAFTDLADLDTSAASVQLTLTAFLVGPAAGQLLIGPLSDRYGRRRPLVVATAITVVVTVICGLAPTIWLLVAMRFVQGLTASAGLVIGRAVGADRTEGAATARIFTLFSAIGGIAPVVAPLLGGVLVSAGSASALMGALQFALGAVVSPLVGLGGPATGVPMGVAIVSCACLGIIARRAGDKAGAVVRPEPEPAHA
ncbi:MFS transporter [Nocardia sp. NPDC002869]|uniref:MFS transporter n=1 Tax=Nocardia sp. NPDC002869 TaxID=3161032 RepID=UPI00398C89BE